MPKFITPVEVTHSTDAAWTDVDVTAHVGADGGDVALVLLEVDQLTFGSNAWGVRKNGSSDTLSDLLQSNEHTFVGVGVDSNDIFELYLTDASDFDVFLVGYVLNEEGGAFTNALDKSTTTITTWEDVDISSDTGGDTATAAFVYHNRTASGTGDYGLRENGSTDAKIAIANADQLTGHIVGLDGSEIFEQWISAVSHDVYVSGYLTDNYTSNTNGIDYSTATIGSYTAVDFSSDIPASNTGAHVHFFNALVAADDMHIRKDNTYPDQSNSEYTAQQFMLVEITTGRTAEQYIQNVRDDLYLLGYTNEPSVAPAATAATGAMTTNTKFWGG